ncbi:hypothetical protein [Kluyvera intermedia]|nr:hypothetical protein [Kluyvera intermedia]
MSFIYRNNRLYIVWLIFVVCISLVYASEQSIYIPLFQLDGAYQTASGLYRINEGYVPGKDFFPYLGLLITWALYPIFLLAGGDMSASVFAAHFMVFIGLSFSLFAFCYFSRSSNAVISVIFSLFCSFFIICTFDTLNIVLFERVTPGNSLRPLRALISPAAFTFMFIIVNKLTDIKRQVIAASFICGIALSWSNDFGYPTAMISGLLYIFCLKRQNSLNIKTFLCFGSMCVIWYVLLSAAMTFGHVISMINYNIDIASDQGWYFGPWSDYNHVFSFPELINNFLMPAIGWKLFALPFCVVLYLKSKNIKHIFQLSIGISLLLGAIISAVGGHIDYEYANAYNFWCYCLCVIYVLNLCIHVLNLRNRFPLFDAHYKYVPLYIIFIGSVVLLFTAGVTSQKIKDAKVKHGYFFSDKLGGYVPVEWHTYLNQDAKDKKVVEDYWGLFSAYNNLFSDAPTDAIIHALGKKRMLFNESLKNADVAITVNPYTAGGWLNWLLSSNWDFYGYILKNYRLEQRFINTDMWVKDAPKIWEEQTCSVVNNTVYLNDAKQGYYEVSITYDLSKAKGLGFYMIKNNFNNAIGVGGYVAIDKNKSVFNFPAYINGDTNDSRTLPLRPTGNITGINIKSCAAKKIIDESNEWFPSSYGERIVKLLNFTDQNWLNGISRSKPGFFLMGSSGINIKEGDYVTFSNGETRKVMRAWRAGEYINIEVSGASLDGAIVGYPNAVRITH